MCRAMIYCFSGTGNSLHAAMGIAERLKPAKIVSMRCDPATFPAVQAEVIGFVFPVYHWTMPALVRAFIEKLPLRRDAYIFGVASCGGLAVNALNDFAALMRGKGAAASYTRVHYNVAGYVAAYEPFPPPEKQLPKAEAELEVIAEEISRGVRNTPPAQTVGKELMRRLERPFVKALPTKDKGFCVSGDCVSCGLCARICMAHNITMENGRPAFRHQCAQCMACVVFCPKGAINYRDKTQTRTKYHHPAVTAGMLAMDTMDFF